VVIMGLRPSFFLFLFIATFAAGVVVLIPFPFAPVINGTVVVEGAVGAMAASISAVSVVVESDAGVGEGVGPEFVASLFAPFIFATWRRARARLDFLGFWMVPVPKSELHYRGGVGQC
jgi:hypothetical protein